MIKGGDIGFFSEDGMKQAGLPKDVVDQLMGRCRMATSI